MSTIQIKRSTTTATPASLANGELAYTSNGDVLYIGSNSAVVAIGGKRTPGTATANQAVVLNGNAHIDATKTGTLIIGPDGTAAPAISTVNAVANSTVLGAAANTELATTWAIKTYVDNKTFTAAPAGANQQIQFNDSGSVNAVASLAFDKSAVVLTVGNTSVNTTVNSSVVTTGTVNTGTANVTTQLNVGANVQLSVSTLSIGNSTVNATMNSTVIAATTLSGSIDGGTF